MCGRLNVTDDPAVQALCETLGINLYPQSNALDMPTRPLFNRFTRVANNVSIIRDVQGKRRLDNAIWWLLLSPTEHSFKASKWTSFNTRYDKLNIPGSAGYQAFRHSRCIVPVKGFGETQGKGSDAVYTDFTAEFGAIALGGLCREWIHQTSQEVVLSCSIITLPAHHKLAQYHSKSSPLMLRQDDDTMHMWLDPSVTDVQILNNLLRPNLPQNLLAQRIDKPSTFRTIGAVERITADSQLL
ncbi:SOS response-associated peptidase family protein [Paraglaciecola aquimarina]|uniref:Abasic site processing protein n=1 Tax=Paraglaciecola aquimarina TaxID=1235557 RepID=A0ABU3SWN5_9ALTE|nr:SOS response-associated peptidase family protein [Paraglaciecola aquimarina]MDU0354327.1 SOS response-associated peptidase family protein [Paraglaciecola aquimarina]